MEPQNLSQFTENQLALCVEMFDLLLVVTDRSDQFHLLSSNWSKFLGYDIRDLTAESFFAFVHPEDRVRTMQEFVQIRNRGVGEGSKDFINRYVAKDGTILTFLWNSRKLDDGKILACAKVIPSLEPTYKDERSLFEELLTSTEMQIFSMFLQQKGRVLLKSEISEQIYGEINVSDKTINVHLSNIRKKVKEFGYTILSPGKGKWKLIHEENT